MGVAALVIGGEGWGPVGRQGEGWVWPAWSSRVAPLVIKGEGFAIVSLRPRSVH